MIARRTVAQRFFPTVSVRDYLELRGLLLSHFIGLALGIPFVLDRVITFSLPYARVIDLPLYFIAIWLFLDRRGRLGHLRPTLWDWLYLGFVAIQAFAFVYADTSLQRLSGFQTYLDWCINTLRPYLFYVVVREALNRRGAQPHIMLYWFLSCVGTSAAIGLMQAGNVPGMRGWTYRFYHQMQTDMALGYSSPQHHARGATPHSNNLAYHMWLGLAVVSGLVWYRRFRIVDIFFGGLLLTTLFFTYSRGGLITTVAMAMGLVLFLAIRKKYAVAFRAGVVVALMGFLALSAIFVFNIQRYKPIVAGEGAVQRMDELGSFRLRLSGATKALEVGMQSPIFGVRAVGAGINTAGVRARTVYAFEGKNDNMYSLMWVFHGAVGLLFLAGLIYGMLSAGAKRHTNHAFSIALFLAGVGFMVHGNTENLVFFDAMSVINVLVALVVAGVKPMEDDEKVGTGFFGMLGRRLKSFG